MNRLLPQEPSVDPPSNGPEVVGLDDEESGDVISVLGSEVARSVLARLYDSPATQSELADTVDTSIQNVDYHLENLSAAGLVEVTDQWYSENGAEMDVYAPTNDPLVLVAGASGRLEDARQAVTDPVSNDAAFQPGD